jgi:hypothetical protein
VAFAILKQTDGLGLRSGLLCLQADISRTSGEQDTGFDFVAGDVILDAWVDIDTAEATGGTKTVDVGLLSSESGGDADGLLDGIVTSATGVIVPKATITTGSNTKFVASATKGILLCDVQAGSDVDQDEGVYVEKKHVVTTAVSLTTTVGSTATELAAKVYVLFWRSPDR